MEPFPMQEWTGVMSYLKTKGHLETYKQRRLLFTMPTPEESIGAPLEEVILTKDGRRYPVPPIPTIREFGARWAKVWRKQTMLPQRYYDFTWESFEIKDMRHQKALEAAQRFAASPHGTLAITGPKGAGKTMLAALVAKYSCYPSIFIDVPSLIQKIFDGFSGNKLGELRDHLSTVPVLVLDEFGADSAELNKAIASHLFSIINFRYSWELPTVLTSNLPVYPLKKTSGTTSSSLLDRAKNDPNFDRLMDRLCHEMTEVSVIPPNGSHRRHQPSKQRRAG